MRNKKKTKVCFVSLQAYLLFNSECDKPHGGSEVQMYQLAKKMAQYDILVVSFVVGDFGQGEKENYDNITVVKAYPVERKNLKYLLGPVFQLKFLRVLKKIDADVYIQRAAGIETGMTALFCKLFKKKFVYMTASSIDADGGFRKRSPLAGFFYEYGLRNADLIITQNEEHKKLIKKNYGKESVVIKNSFAIPNKILPAEDRKYILWVGSAQELKQPQIFLEIAEALSEENFVMIMPKHNRSLWEKTEREAQSLPNLKFIEKVPFDKINEHFAKAKMFVNTSTFEGFPNTFVQAAMYGTPIASLNVNPDNFLNEYDCGFCARGDIEKIIESIKEIMNNKLKWEAMSGNVRNYAKENHDINKNTEKIKYCVSNLVRENVEF